MSQLAELLMERISGSLDRFVADMASHLEARIEAEIERFSSSFEAELSAFCARLQSGKRARTKPQNALKAVEADAIKETLEAHDGNVSRAARSLGIHRQSLQRKLKREPEVAVEAEATPVVTAPVVAEARRACGCAMRGRHRRDCRAIETTTREAFGAGSTAEGS